MFSTVLGTLSPKTAAFPRSRLPPRGSQHPMTDQGEGIKAWPPHPESGQLSKTIPTPELHLGRAAAFTGTVLQPSSPSAQTHVLPLHPRGAVPQEHNVTRYSHASLPLPENPLPGEPRLHAGPGPPQSRSETGPLVSHSPDLGLQSTGGLPLAGGLPLK